MTGTRSSLDPQFQSENQTSQNIRTTQQHHRRVCVLSAHMLSVHLNDGVAKRLTLNVRSSLSLSLFGGQARPFFLIFPSVLSVCLGFFPPSSSFSLWKTFVLLQSKYRKAWMLMLQTTTSQMCTLTYWKMCGCALIIYLFIYLVRALCAIKVTNFILHNPWHHHTTRQSPPVFEMRLYRLQEHLYF